jgi:hypothetical protein
MPSPFWRKSRRALALAFIILGTMSILAVAWLNPRLTRYVESDLFRAEIEKETAKGLHFPSGHYEPIQRTGTWTAESAGFEGHDGWKAMRSLNAHGITAQFNPLGVFLRRWQLDDIHIQRGEVEIQVYEPQPEPSPTKPWYTKYFLPERVYLNHVESDTADVTWRFREKRAGIFSTRLLITPHDRDFEYQAREGWLRMQPFSEMRVQHVHLLITRELLTLYNMDLEPKAPVNGRIHAEGKAGTRPNDRSVDFRFSIERVSIDALLSADWREHLSGLVRSTIHWTGEDTKLEHSRGEAECNIEDARIHDLPFLEKIASLTNDKSLRQIKLDAFRFDTEWNYPSIDLKRCLMEDKGKFRAEGELFVRKESLRGTINLGIAPTLLEFLTAPVVKEVFPREKDGYLWTTVHLSGTIEAPQQDLSDRILEKLKEHPTAALILLFRQISEALHNSFGQD